MIEVKGLYFAYPKNQIFTNFDFQSDSDFIILKGPSGCGKTTLLKLLSSNLIADKCEKLIVPTKICTILQEDALFPWLSGIDNILNIVNINYDEIKEHPMMEHLKTFINKKAFEMSYGQRRLIELFRAILYKPDLLCLDEPFNFLDPNSRNIVCSFLKMSNEQNRTKVIMSTHYNERNLNFQTETFYFDGTFPITRLCTRNIFDETEN
ncbi:MAG: ATP-binding cassette domain-containing protein [Dysgonamonadaceae bacterium]|jgi:ABC-type multidrug transport system ATPase subunit|nr:ATP-binding cassette domain-containing protein [Dysgonamonadaceae bacterium]